MITFGLFCLEHGHFEAHNVVDQAKLAERSGFDTIWTGEHLFTDHIQGPAPLIQAVQIGQHVKCQIGTAIIVLPFHHPLVLAGEIAAGDLMLDGRLNLGFGRGASVYEYERLGMAYDPESTERSQEMLDILDRIWASEDHGVSYDGKYFKFPNTYVYPRPYQKPHPPVWYAGQALESVEVGVSRGYNVLHTPFLKPFSHLEQMAELFHRARERHGVALGALKFGFQQRGFVAEREIDVINYIRETQYDQQILLKMRTDPNAHDERGHVEPPAVPIYSDEALGPSGLYNVPDVETLRENLLVGTPDEVLEKVEREHRMGVDHIIFTPAQRRMTQDEILQTIQLFGEKVIRPYRERHAADISELEHPAAV